MFLNGARLVTNDASVTIKQLDACESYTFDVAIVGPLGYGSGSERMVSLTTEFDRRSRPKNVNVRFAPHSSTDLVLSWAPPCAVLSAELGYVVVVRDGVIKKASTVSLSATRNTTLQLPLKVHYGGRYEMTVRTDELDSLASAPIKVDGPSIPPPHQLSVGREADGTLILYWRDQDLPPEVVTHNYSYVIWISDDKNFDVGFLFFFFF